MEEYIFFVSERVWWSQSKKKCPRSYTAASATLPMELVALNGFIEEDESFQMEYRSVYLCENDNLEAIA